MWQHCSMAKKTKKSKRNIKSVSGSTSVSAERAIGVITKPFVDWYEDTHDVSAETALSILDPVLAFAANYFELTPAAEVTNFDPEIFERAMAELVLDLDGGTEDDVDFVWESVHLYVEFLADTRAWTGSPEDLETVHGMFHGIEPEGKIPQLKAPDLTPEQELAGLEETVLAQRVEALLRWVGRSREVTATGALKLKEIEGAAAALGLRARGGKSASWKDSSNWIAGEATEDEPIHVVRSMNELTPLVILWTVLQAAHLIDIGSTVVRTTPLAANFLGHEDTKLAVLRDVTTKFLEVSVHGEAEWAPWVSEAAGVQTAVLIAAATDSPPELENVRHMLTAADGPLQSDMAGPMALRRIEYLAELGLVTLGMKITVPPAIVASVAVAFADAFAGSAEEGESAGSDSRFDPNAPILQLKVSINRASPPIWRRLLVNSSLALGDLHTVIQSSFQWDDSHLHAFQVGGRGGAVYGPPNPDPWGEPDLDENAYTVDEILPAEGDSMVYTYDFGDDWEHLIKVEKILPAEPDAAIVRCTGGRGRGPAEDCGGPHGWAMLVEAANDPLHEEHKEYRRWLGLAKGAKFDPTNFDKVGLNEDLSGLF